jgi:uncharacterized protein (TIGR03067 family)
MFRLALTTATCFLLLPAAWADDKEDSIKKEVEKFQGEWKLVGQDEITLKFKGNEYEFNAGEAEKGKMKFNPATKPAQVDVDIKEGNDAGKKQVGIYEFKGDKVTFCFAAAGQTKRPTKFERSEDDSILLFEFQKVKK